MTRSHRWMPAASPVIGLLLCAVACCCVAATRAAYISFSSLDDVVIFNNGTHWRCDRIYCPSDAVRCHVSKEKAPKDAAVLVRTNICYDKNGQIVQKQVTEEAVSPHHDVRLSVESYRNGQISTGFINGPEVDLEPFRQQLHASLSQLHHNLRTQLHNIQQQVAQITQNLPFL